MEHLARYFDNAATTPVDPLVLREMLPFLELDCGNPESIHALGKRAEHAVEVARERVASLAGADDPSQIVFTAGATESCNWVISNYSQGWVSPFEHSAVFRAATHQGYRVLPNTGTEVHLYDSKDELLALMAVNNETGTIWDPSEYNGSAPLLCDATQAFGKLPVQATSATYMAFSAHKLYGPKGVGALFLSEPLATPLLWGGGQEHGQRSGTLNVPGIVGFGAACALAEEHLQTDFAKAEELRSLLIERLCQATDWRINGTDTGSPFILSLSFGGLVGESLVVELDAAGFYISAGAACSSRSKEPSRVLKALYGNDPWNEGTIRISFGRTNTLESVAKLGAMLLQSVEKLRTIR